MKGKKSTADRGLYRRRGSPHWWIRYSDANGRIMRESSGTSEKKLARAILGKKKTLVAEGRHLDKKQVLKTTFYELCTQYWQLWGQHKRMKGLSNMIEIWKQSFGNVPLEELTQKRVEQFLTWGMESEKRNWSSATRNRHLTMLKAMFNKGKEWELAMHNSAAGIKPLRENGARIRFLDIVEIRALLEAADDEFRPILIAALHTGMRRGEILNLRWEDVNLKNRIITVQESKSGKKRMIPIDDTLYGTLRLLPSRFHRGYVFPLPGKPERRWQDFRKRFASAVKKAGIKDFRFHDTRHTFASHLVMNGVDIKSVQELLGHASLAMTMKYAHLAPDHRLRAIKTLDLAFQTDTNTDTVENSMPNPSSQTTVK